VAVRYKAKFEKVGDKWYVSFENGLNTLIHREKLRPELIDLFNQHRENIFEIEVPNENDLAYDRQRVWKLVKEEVKKEAEMEFLPDGPGYYWAVGKVNGHDRLFLVKLTGRVPFLQLIGSTNIFSMDEGFLGLDELKFINYASVPEMPDEAE
jgi:hypothetical protein